MNSRYLRILLIEDMEHYRKLCIRMLEESSLFTADVDWTDRLSTGIEKCRENSYNIVLLDLDLPDSTGMDTIEHFRVAHSDTPVIVVSGSYEGDTLLRTLQWGVQDYLVKGKFDKYLLTKSILYAVEKDNIESALHEKQQLLEILLEGIPNPIFFKDSDKFYIGCNQAFCDSFGIKREQVIGRTVFDLQPKEVATVYDRMDDELLRKPGKQMYESKIYWADKSEHDVIFSKATYPDLRQEVGGIIGVILDITERKQAELATQQSRQKFLAIFEASPDAMLIIDRETQQIVEANFAFTQLTGMRPEEMSVEQLEKMDLISDCYKRQEKGIEQCSNREMIITLPDGNHLSVLCSSVLFEIGGRKNNLIILRDITELKSLQSELQHAHKMESIGRLAAGIAHEINTPIQYISDNLEFLRESFDDLLEGMKNIDIPDELADELDIEFLREEIPTAFRQALEGVQRVAHIVNAMRSFAHPGREDKQQVDISSLVESTITVARNEWKYVADIQMDIAKGLPPVWCYPGDLRQTLLNLLVNAAHAISNTLDGKDGSKGLIEIHAYTSESKLVLEVRDNGSGIPEEVQPHVFDPFFTTKEVGQGTGQGLSIAYNAIVKKHGGDLSFETEPGAGTTFRISLPL